MTARLSLVLAFALAATTGACAGGETDDTGTGGNGGDPSTGAAGATGNPGAGGDSGSAGSGATAGSAGPGAGGTTGTAGATGTGTGGRGGTTGSGGSSGSNGTAGTTATAGRGGTTGGGGVAGTTGAAGRGGTGGSAGTTGAAGRGGSSGAGGMAGATGAAGRGGTTGGGGSGSTGSGGQPSTGICNFASGLNIAWVMFANDVPNPEIATFNTIFKNTHDAGGRVIRWWFHTNGTKTPGYDSSGMAQALPQSHIDGVKAILSAANANGVSVNISLWSFDMLQSNAGNTYVQNQTLLENDTNKQTYVDNYLTPLVNAIKRSPSLYS
jgi:hypothetical protein